MSGWTPYVLPTEGYSIAAPSDWVVSLGREGAEAVAGRLAGISGSGGEDGSRWSIYRMAQRGSLLELGQRRVEEILADSGTEAGSIEFRTKVLAVGSAVRIEYQTRGNPGRWVREYVVVRGNPASPSSLGYSIELSATTSELTDDLEMLAVSFSLLGVEP